MQDVAAGRRGTDNFRDTFGGGLDEGGETRVRFGTDGGPHLHGWMDPGGVDVGVREKEREGEGVMGKRINDVR